MSNYTFSSIKPLDKVSFLSTGFFLCVLHADKIPPHIGVLKDGLYYSLKAKGKDVAIPYVELLKVVNRKLISTLFVEMNKNVSNEVIEKVYGNYEKAIAYEASCLSPLKEIFSLGDTVQKLDDFLVGINHQGFIKNVYSLFLPEDYCKIPLYEVNEIHSRLEKLNSKLKIKHV